MQVVATVKETFNIFDDGRQYNAAPQKFLLSALSDVLHSGLTKERIKLKEAIGYFGHSLRQLTGKIRPNEVEMIEKNGKVAAVNMVPAIRTKSCVVDNQGNVTHEQEFLDTEEGRAAYSVYKSGTGGFSWAMSGSNGHNTKEGSVTKSFSGFDFVMQPNFIPKHRQTMLLSSMGDNTDMLLSSMVDDGIEKERAEQLLSHFQTSHIDDDINDLLLSSLVSEKQGREQLLSSVIDQSPFFINERQREALIRCGNNADVEVLNALFSSMQNTDLSHLPVNKMKPQAVREKAQAPTVGFSYPTFEKQTTVFK